MPTPKKSKPKAGKAQGSALDSKQRELQEQEAQLRAKIDALQRTISEAPQRVAEERQRARQAVTASQQRQYTLGASTLDTRHFEAAVAAGKLRPNKGRKKPAVLRAEKKAAWLQTVAITIVLAFAICWLLSHPPDFILLFKWLHLN